MNLSFSLGMYQVQLCTVCDQSLELHAPSCPVGKLDELLKAREVHDCPKCQGRVEVNLDDFFECGKCHRQFSSGIIAPAKKKGLLILMNRKTHEIVHVRELAELGKGRFKWSEIAKTLQDEIDRIKREKN